MVYIAFIMKLYDEAMNHAGGVMEYERKILSFYAGKIWPG
jgi:hypothetical protein